MLESGGDDEEKHDDRHRDPLPKWLRPPHDAVGPTACIRVDPHQLDQGLVGHIDLFLGASGGFVLTQSFLNVMVEEVLEVSGDFHQDQAPGGLRKREALPRAV